MKKGSIKGVDGNELEAYFPSNLNELDVNENSAGCGAHEEAMKKKCCGGGCHSDKVAGKVFEFPTTLSWDAPKEIIKDFVEKAKAANKEVANEASDALSSAAAYDYPLDKAFDYGYNVDVDPINQLFKMTSKFSPQNKVKIDDTIESDLLENKDLKLGRLYRVAGMNLVARFVAQIIIPVEKTLLQIKHHGIIFYVEEKQLKKATPREVQEYLGQF